jgi:RND family efflux transporter MFP subunit
MKNKLFKKETISAFGKIILISFVVVIGLLVLLRANFAIKTKALEIKSIASTIQADGVVTPQNQAILHFQTGEKLIYIPFKEGDFVYQGQIIASLDASKFAANLRQAEQNFTAAKAVSEKYYNDHGNNTAESYDEKIKRTAVDAAQNIAYDNVVKARQDLANATLVSPIDGTLIHEDVTTPFVNITPATSFIVADLSSLVFQANVSENDIDFMSIGNAAAIKLGNGKLIEGIVDKIYPDKITLFSGQKMYQVDIKSTKTGELGLMGQTGTVLIQSNLRNNVSLVPTWTMLNHESVWVQAQGNPVLRNIVIGKTHGDMTEVLGGLKTGDKIIINPESIAGGKYAIF